MNKSTTSVKLICFLCLSFCTQQLFAHNGTIGYAYPLPGKILVDGDFSDWPKNIMTYPISTVLSETKPASESDFNGSFQMGYRAEDRSLYLAFTITDDDFIEDTSENVRWNTQDALELYLDARHLPFGSGVASFMYSKKLRNTNNAYYDPFARNAKWNIIEVAMVKKGNTRYYEWRINLGNEFAVGKSIGLDFNAFDLDSDKSFSYSSWGAGEMKYVNPRSLCDVLLIPANEKLAAVSGSIAWDKKTDVKLPAQIRLLDINNQKNWVTATVDSTGNYAAEIPAGKYNLAFADTYFQRKNNVNFINFTLNQRIYNNLLTRCNFIIHKIVQSKHLF